MTSAGTGSPTGAGGGAPITVLGGTGKSGRRVAAALRAAGQPVRVASRSGEVRFDWADPDTWPAVLDGAAAVYLIAPEDPAPVRPFVNRAVAAGVRRLVLLSGRGGPEAWRGRFGHSMAVAEEVVGAADLDWAIVRANNFMQNFTEDLWHAPLLAGRLALPTGGVPEPLVDLDDVAAVAARLLVADGPAREIHELSGPTALRYAEAVALIAEAAGRPIAFEELTPEAYAAELRADGLDETWVAELSGLFEVLREGHMAAPATGVEQVLGRPPRSFADWVARTAQTGVWAAR
jgi:uncharacterized protein YbjT (DUF2867 family)